MPVPPAALSEALQALVGRTVGRVRVRAGSFLLIDLESDADLTDDDPTSPLLWVYLGAWQLRRDGVALAACEDDRPRMEEACERLVGRTLTSLVVSMPGPDLQVGFEELLLRIFCTHTELSVDPVQEIEWAAWLPSREVAWVTTSGGAVVEGAGQSQVTRWRADLDTWAT